MELALIIPVDPQETYSGPTEWLCGSQWRVSEPIDVGKQANMKYHCISYVWGQGRSKEGLFQSQIPISDQTRPALEASIEAMDAAAKHSDVPDVKAFWIDSVCVPQADGPKRKATLESMGFIYGSATATVVVLQQLSWKILKQNVYKPSVSALSFDEMAALEKDAWIKSPWTYQEVVNSRATIFTCQHIEEKGLYMRGEQMLNCVGFSLEEWKKNDQKGEVAVIKTFPNLSAISDTYADALMAEYLGRNAFMVLSNMALRRYDPTMESNHILASLGALTKTASWTTKNGTISERVNMFMEICEAGGDYSFIYTKDIRDVVPGRRWRPNPTQPEPCTIKTEGENQINHGHRNLAVVLSWHSWCNPIGDTQRGRHDSAGFWLAKMVPLQSSTRMSQAASSRLATWLCGGVDESPSPRNQGFAGNQLRLKGDGDGDGVKLEDAMFAAISSMGFSGSPEAHVCNSGVFFSQLPLADKSNVEMFAAASISWMFGSPGLARWTERPSGNRETDGETHVVKYAAGVFAGIVDVDLADWLLMI